MKLPNLSTIAIAELIVFLTELSGLDYGTATQWTDNLTVVVMAAAGVLAAVAKMLQERTPVYTTRPGDPLSRSAKPPESFVKRVFLG